MRQQPASARNLSTEPTSVRVQGWDAQFGRGYVVGFLTFFAVTMVSGAIGVLSQSIRWLAVAVAAFGGLFAFGFLYHTVQGIGFPGGTLRTPRVLSRSRHPIAYWLVVAVGLALSFATVAGGVWVLVNADRATATMERHRPTGGGR